MPFDGTKLDAVTQRLIEGRAKIDAGWCKNALTYMAKGGPQLFCMVGAVLRGGVRNLDEPAYEGAVARLAEFVPPIPGQIEPIVKARVVAYFNDAPERTKGEVLAVFDRAIAKNMNG